jgi:hypothetical protein
MNPHDHQDLRNLLTQNIAPVRDTQLRRDLWPQVLQRLEQQPPIHVPWFDWALAAAAGTVLIFSPGAIPALLYHL